MHWGYPILHKAIDLVSFYIQVYSFIIQMLIYVIPAGVGAALAILGVCSSVPPTPPTASAEEHMYPFFKGLKKVGAWWIVLSHMIDLRVNYFLRFWNHLKHVYVYILYIYSTVIIVRPVFTLGGRIFDTLMTSVHFGRVVPYGDRDLGQHWLT